MSRSAIYCGHANEMPSVCRCDEDCYCRVEGSCRWRIPFPVMDRVPYRNQDERTPTREPEPSQTVKMLYAMHVGSRNGNVNMTLDQFAKTPIEEAVKLIALGNASLALKIGQQYVDLS